MLKNSTQEIERVMLSNYGPLRYSENRVVESRAVEESPVGGAKSPENTV